MKPLVLFVLLPVATWAQRGERFLEATAVMLANNRSSAGGTHFFGDREKTRLDTSSTNPETNRRRIFDYIWEQDYEQAAGWLEKTTARYPKQHGMAGEIYLSTLYDFPRAITHFDAYDALTPGFDDIIGINPVSYLRGLAYREQGDHAKAIQQFSVAIDSLESRHGAEWVNYRHFISRAVSYIATQQAEKALVDLVKSLKNFNRSALAQYHRGRALLQLNRIAEARTAFQEASFFFKALRAERAGDYQEDNLNPVTESQIDDALTDLKPQIR